MSDINIVLPTEILKLVRASYPIDDVISVLVEADGQLTGEHDCSDGLAVFVVDKLCDAVDGALPWDDQVDAAVDALNAASNDLAGLAWSIGIYRNHKPDWL